MNPLDTSALLAIYEPMLRTFDLGEDVCASILERIAQSDHGDMTKWAQAVASLPELSDVTCTLDVDAVTARGALPADYSAEKLTDTLQALHPWRKGPFQINDLLIDTEWRSDTKWTRLAQGISPLEGRRVLDIGTGSGYHCWRMRGAGADCVLGIEPMLLYVMQFLAIRHFINDPSVWVTPWAIEDMPAELENAFDTVFSMGVLYHRKSPLEHVRNLMRWCRSGGEIILETLVIEGDAQQLLIPRKRYAQMRNVWFIPSTAMLGDLLTHCGLKDVRCLDVSVTTTNEQRSTDWMRFHSLKNFLHPDDSTQTAEGYPAPMRAIFSAQCP